MRPTSPVQEPIESLGWLSGRWIGASGNERLEETWGDPHAGTLLGMFRWDRAERPFYELLTVETEPSGLVFRIRHFDPGMVPWEKEDGAVTLDLVATGDDQATFLKRGERRWMVYRREPGDQLVSWFETEASPYRAGDEFRFTRG